MEAPRYSLAKNNLEIKLAKLPSLLLRLAGYLVGAHPRASVPTVTGFTPSSIHHLCESLVTGKVVNAIKHNE